jgi:LuxR family transcriptional regulator, maltose regulon positive regulatory protein
MRGSDVSQRAGGPGHLGRPAFDLAVSKFWCPLVRPELVRRSSLIERLARDDGRPIVSVVAPAGYGKTTLLSQ